MQFLRAPSECSETELAEFERLVRLGFEGSDDTLPTRIRAAKTLAFQFDSDAGVVAIAGLKQPKPEYTAEVFARTGCGVDPDGWRLELGWVFVSPMHRAARMGRGLCERLLRSLDSQPVFATTRPDNQPMIRILESLGFRRSGRPFQKRSQTLVIYMRVDSDDPGPTKATTGLL